MHCSLEKFTTELRKATVSAMAPLGWKSLVHFHQHSRLFSRSFSSRANVFSNFHALCFGAHILPDPIPKYHSRLNYTLYSALSRGLFHEVIKIFLLIRIFTYGAYPSHKFHKNKPQIHLSRVLINLDVKGLNL